MWEDNDTPPVLKESDLHFRIAQNQQRIDTLIIQARRQFHHRNISQVALLPLATEDTSRIGFFADATAWNAERRTQPEEKHTGDYNI